MSTMHRSKQSESSSLRRKKNIFLIIGSLVGFVIVLLSDPNSSHRRAMSDLSYATPDMFAPSNPNAKWSSSDTNPNSEEWSCSWFPKNHARCDEILSRRIPPPVKSADELRDDDDEKQHQRWIFFGDSTMKRLFDRSDLKEHLIQHPSKMSKKKCFGKVTCKEHQQKDRCELNSVYDLPYVDQWEMPDPFMFEGPIRYGAMNGNEFCTDCSGCQTHFLECSFDSSINEGTKCGDNRKVYGGYMTMEFARDRVLQTPELGTTQENIAAYISNTWNTPELVRDWGKPICVFSGGNHDIIVPGMSKEKFTSNVQWMLKTLQPQCHHMIWLSNTPNKRKSRFPQHIAIMKSWDGGVKDLIAADPDLLGMSSFIDVLDASLNFPHADYIHMDDKWYKELGKWFTSFM